MIGFLIKEHTDQYPYEIPNDDKQNFFKLINNISVFNKNMTYF